MATIRDAIEAYTGALVGAETGSAQVAYTENVKTIITLSHKTAPEKSYLFATGSSDANPSIINDDIVLEVSRDDVIAIEVPSRLANNLADENSIYYATNDSPAYYKSKQKLFIHPTGGTANTDVIEFATWSIASTAGQGLFPENWSVLPTLAAAKTIFHKRLVAKTIETVASATATIPGDVTLATASIDLPTYTPADAIDLTGVDATLTVPSPAAIAYTAATGTAVGEITVGGLGTVPGWGAVTYVAATALGVNVLNISGVVEPTAPSPATGYTGATGTLGATATVTAFTGAPTYTTPNYSPVDFPSGTTALAALDITTVTVPAIGYLGASSTATYVSATASAIATATVGSLGTAPSYSPPGISWMATGTGAGTGEQTQADWETLTRIIELEEDAELAGAQSEKISAILQKYQSDMQNKVNEFNKENAIYQQTVQEAVTNATMAQQKATQDAQLLTTISDKNASQLLQTELANITNALQRHQTELGAYQAEINTKLQEWTQNEFALKYQRWQAEDANSLQQYQLDIQDKLNLFNQDNAAYQADIQKQMAETQILAQKYAQDAQTATTISLQNAAQEASTSLQNDQNDLGRFSAEVQAYNAEINGLVTEHTTNMQRELQIWQADSQQAMALYTADIQQESQKLNEEIAIYQSTVQKAMTDAQMAHQSATLNAQTATTISTQTSAQNMAVAVQNSQNELAKYNAEVSKWGAQLQKAVSLYQSDQAFATADVQGEQVKYASEMQRVAESNQSQLGKYGAELQAFSQDIQANASLFNSKMTEQSTEYQWTQGQLAHISNEYTQHLNILLGAGQDDT
jgi:hypothetical protein